MQGVSETGRMFRGEYEPKGGGAACVAGRAGEGRCLYENASWQAYLWMAERDDRTILRGGQGEPWPALCAHAWNTEHAGAVFPDSGGAKYQEAGGLFLSRFSSLSNTLPLRLYLNVELCQWSEAAHRNGERPQTVDKPQSTVTFLKKPKKPKGKGSPHVEYKYINTTRKKTRR